MLNSVVVASEVIPTWRATAQAAGPLVFELRKADRNASLADAIMLPSARWQGAKLVSGDACLARQRDVLAS